MTANKMEGSDFTCSGQDLGLSLGVWQTNDDLEAILHRQLKDPIEAALS